MHRSPNAPQRIEYECGSPKLQLRYNRLIPRLVMKLKRSCGTKPDATYLQWSNLPNLLLAESAVHAYIYKHIFCVMMLIC